MNTPEVVLFIFIITILFIYFTQFYIYIFKIDTNRIILRRFHNAVCSIYKSKMTTLSIINKNDYWFEQLILNYEKLCEEYPNNKYINILDILQTLVHYYDTYSDKYFKDFFKVKKDLEFREFIMSICIYIKQENPFISIPAKEASLLQSIQHALDDNNVLLGKNAIEQLSQEIEAKEKKLIKQDKTNKIATIISIIGIVFTIFFGFISWIPISK